MTKKDYRLIAQAIREEYESALSDLERATIYKIAYRLSSLLEKDNPRFSHFMFINACFPIQPFKNED